MDKILGKANFTWLYGLGSILIFMAFGVIMAKEWKRKHEEAKNLEMKDVKQAVLNDPETEALMSEKSTNDQLNL